MLCWFCLATIFWWKKKYLASAIVVALSVLTKETGVYLILLLPCFSFVQLRNKEISNKTFWYSLSLMLLPIFTFLAFVIVQKAQMGFYLSPTNMGKTSSSLDGVFHKFVGAVKFIFLAQNRWCLLILVALVMVLEKPTIPFYVYGGLFIIVTFGLASAILSHPLERYLLFPIVVWVLIVAWAITRSSRLKGVAPLVLLVPLVLNVLQVDGFKTARVSDADLSYRQAVKNIQETLKYIGEEELSPVVLESPYKFTQEHRTSGYSILPKTVKVLKDKTTGDHYKVFSNPGNLEMKSDAAEYAPFRSFDQPLCRSEIRLKANP